MDRSSRTLEQYPAPHLALDLALDLAMDLAMALALDLDLAMDLALDQGAGIHLPVPRPSSPWLSFSQV